MAWVLVGPRDPASPDITQAHPLTSGDTLYLCLNLSEGLQITTSTELSQPALARLEKQPWGWKLIALDEDVIVRPSCPRYEASVDPHSEAYRLEKRTSTAQHEAIFLRDGDGISASVSDATYTLVYSTSEVQVNSSVSTTADVNQLGNGHVGNQATKIAVQDTASETEDDEDLDQTVTMQPAALADSAVSRLTPVPSFARTEVIQETPTIERTTIHVTSENSHSTVQGQAIHTAQHGEVVMQEFEPFSTAPGQPNGDADNETAVDADNDKSSRIVDQKAYVDQEITPQTITDEHSNTQDENDSGHTSSNGGIPSIVRGKPSVRIPLSERGKLKRASPEEAANVGTPRDERPKKRAKALNADPDSPSAHVNRSNKRTSIARGEPKDGETGEDSRSNISIDSKDTAASSARKSGRKLTSLTTTRKSPTTLSRTGKFTQAKPKVAFSNSALPDMPEIMKRFKAMGGLEVKDVMKGNCDLLCVRPGNLRKSMKLIACISLGVMVVTDKWLQDSVKTGHFLAPQEYMPSFPQQEKDWNFSMKKIFGQPQSTVLEGKTLFFTPALVKLYAPLALKDIEKICQAAGANRAISKSARDIKDTDDDKTQTVILALDEDDQDMYSLIEHSHTCYTRDLLTHSILRGQMDLDSDEFKITIDSSQRPARKRGRLGKKG